MNQKIFSFIFILGLASSITLTGLCWYGIFSSAIAVSFEPLFMITMPTVALILCYFKYFRK